MSAAGEPRVYRPPLLTRSLGWVICAIYLAIGLSMVSIGPSERDGPSAVVIGALVLLLSLWLGAVLATNRLVATATGVQYSYYLRRRVVSWAEIQSFGVGPSNALLLS